MQAFKAFDIFPWNDNFKTHIPKIDEQHKKLVELLNILASHVAFNSDLPDIHDIFSQLTDYTIYHLQTEEEIWHQYLPDDTLEQDHKVAHENFIDKMQGFQALINAKPSEQIIAELLSFLSGWLFAHILESDRYLALVVSALQTGLPLNVAKTQASTQAQGATEELISGNLDIYNELASNTMYLIHEITEQKKRGALLAQEENHHKTLISLLPVGIFETDKDCICTYVNKRWTDITGVAYKNAIGTYWKKSIHPDDSIKVDEEWFASIKNNRPFSLEFRFLHSNGKSCWVLGLLAPVRSENMQISGYLGVLTDITQTKQTEQTLLKTTSSLVRAQKVAHIGNWSYRVADSTIQWSAELYNIFGRQKNSAKLNNQTLLSWIHPEDRNLYDAYLQTMRTLSPNDLSQIKDLQYRLIRPDGQVRWVDVTSECEFSENDQPALIFGTVQDITARIHIEQFEKFRSTILEYLAKETSLDFILTKIVTGIEALNPDMLCSILLMNQTGTHLENGIAPSLPDFYNKAVDNLEIDLGVASFGTAAFTGQTVIVDDILTHPYWTSCRELATQAGLRACWSQPIISSNGIILGTFAIYHQYVHTPSATDIKLIEQAAHLVSIAIEKSRADQYLRESENRMRVLFENAPLAYQSLDVDGNILEVNALWLAQMGYTRDEVIGRFIGDFIKHDPNQAFEEKFPDFQQIDKVDDPVFTMQRKDGSDFLWQVNGRINPDIQGQFTRTHCLLTDITKRQQAQTKLQLCANVFTHAREGIAITDASGTIIEVNETFIQVTGYSRDELIGQNPRMLQSGRQTAAFYEAMWNDLSINGHWTGEIWNRRKNGELYAELLTISDVRDENDNILNYVALFTDITQMKEHQQQLEYIAHYDILTGLPNRALLADRLSQAMLHTQRSNRLLAVLFVDLDGFKAVNDQHGHDIGDQLLIKVAQRMQGALRSGDTLARLGGDEFVAVLVDLGKLEDCEPVLERLLKAASKSVIINNAEMHVSASIGVTLYPQDPVDTDQLIRHADQAMYIAKQIGKNRYHLFDTVQAHAMKTQHEHIKNIRIALTCQQFVLYYQPKVNMRTKQVMGVEALIRWEHPERGLVTPNEFLPQIENHAISITLGEWVINTALKQMADWQAMGLAIPISVNIGALQLQQGNFVTRLTELLTAHPEVSSDCLELEVLETSALSNIQDVSSIMNACCKLGVQFALDDFGTGYSSLTYLRRLPAELIKIDQTFVRDMLNNPDDLAIVKGVISLAKTFQRRVIAEGVETTEHGKALQALGCELAQGYGIARPMPAKNVPEWLESWSTNDT